MVLVLSIYRGLCTCLELHPYTWFPMPLELWESKGEEARRMEKTTKYKEYFSGGAEIYGTVDDLYLASRNDLELEETARNEVFFISFFYIYAYHTHISTRIIEIDLRVLLLQ